MGNYILFPAPPQTYYLEDKLVKDHIVWVHESKENIHIPVLCLSCVSKHIIMYFHGNSVDLGDVFNEMMIIFKAVNCNVVALEYPGYGICSKHVINPSKIDEWALTVFEWLQKNKINPLSITVMGRSIGTGPASKLAATLKSKGIHVGGIILHSPYISIHKIISEYVYLGIWLINNYWDIQDNLKITSPTIPLLIIHGMNDEIIPVSHGKTLFNNYRAFSGLKLGYFPQDSPHNSYNIIDDVAVPMAEFLETKALSKTCDPCTLPIKTTRKTKSVPPETSRSEILRENIEQQVENVLKRVGSVAKCIDDEPTKDTLVGIRSLDDI